jgi:hypothetical protein
MAGSVTSLFVSSLQSVDLDQALDSPSGVGGQLWKYPTGLPGKSQGVFEEIFRLTPNLF